MHAYGGLKCFFKNQYQLSLIFSLVATLNFESYILSFMENYTYVRKLLRTLNLALVELIQSLKLVYFKTCKLFTCFNLGFSKV